LRGVVIILKRVSISIGVIALVFGSLITFPEYLPWMMSVWLLISVAMGFKEFPMWPWLVGCALIVAAKRPGFTPEFWMFIISVLGVALADWQTRNKRSESHNTKRLAIFAAVLLSVTTVYGVTRWLASNASQKISPDARCIACLGDSLTGYGYPDELQKLISVPVADFGVNGITTDDGIKMIPDILAADPQMVIIELGGHDYNADKKTRSATGANLEQLIEAFLERDIGVVLVEIPRGFISDPYDGLERELTAKYDLQLIDDSIIRSFVFNSPLIPPGSWLPRSQRYSDDGLHPNELGNQHFANVVAQALTKLCGSQIRK